MSDGERPTADRLAAAIRETAAIERRLEEAERSREPGARREALEAACAHSCAAHTWYLPELLADLAQARAGASDHEAAVRWFEGGLEVAMRDGDPERLVDQLVDLRARSLEALGRDPDDELTRRAQRFVESWEPPPREPLRVSVRTEPAPAEPRPEPCPHCGWSEDVPDAVLDEADERLRFGEPPVRGPRMEMAIAWLPRDAFAQALERWPELREDWEDGDHAAYSARIEEGLRELRSSAARPVRVAPVRDLDDLVSFCAKKDEDPASSAGRAAYAAELQRTGETIPWPPGRNDPCWCGSKTKYKRCCGRI